MTVWLTVLFVVAGPSLGGRLTVLCIGADGHLGVKSAIDQDCETACSGLADDQDCETACSGPAEQSIAAEVSTTVSVPFIPCCVDIPVHVGGVQAFVNPPRQTAESKWPIGLPVGMDIHGLMSSGAAESARPSLLNAGFLSLPLLRSTILLI